MGRGNTPNGVAVRGLRVLHSTEYRRIRWGATLIGLLFGDFGAAGDEWHVMTVREIGTRRVVARRRFADSDDARRARARFVEVVAAMSDEEHGRAQWQAVFERVGSGGGSPGRSDVLVVDGDGYIVPAVRGVGVGEVVVDDGWASLHVGSHTVRFGAAAAGPAAGRVDVRAVDGTVVRCPPAALPDLIGAVCARLALRHDGRLVLHLADGRRLEATQGWEVAVRGRTVVASGAGGGIELLPRRD